MYSLESNEMTEDEKLEQWVAEQNMTNPVPTCAKIRRINLNKRGGEPGTVTVYQPNEGYQKYQIYTENSSLDETNLNLSEAFQESDIIENEAHNRGNFKSKSYNRNPEQTRQKENGIASALEVELHHDPSSMSVNGLMETTENSLVRSRSKETMTDSSDSGVGETTHWESRPIVRPASPSGNPETRTISREYFLIYCEHCDWKEALKMEMIRICKGVFCRKCHRLIHWRIGPEEITVMEKLT